jgi:nitrogen fixation protein FixH
MRLIFIYNTINMTVIERRSFVASWNLVVIRNIICKALTWNFKIRAGKCTAWLGIEGVIVEASGRIIASISPITYRNIETSF